MVFILAQAAKLLKQNLCEKHYIKFFVFFLLYFSGFINGVAYFHKVKSIRRFV